MPDDLCVLHTLAESLKDDDILRASTGANSYFTQTLRMDAAKGPESEAFFKIPDPVEKTVASTGSSDAVNQGKPADIQKTIQNSNVEGQAEVAYEPTLVNTGPLSPVDATVQSVPVISSTEEKQPQTPPKNVEKRIEYKTEYVFRSPVDLLGSGSFGIVYRSEDSEFKRKVALKCLKPEHLYHALTPTSFLLEAEINGKLDHPG
ncbi:MAG: hypothetical protein ACKO85_18965, partial [Isosphaeraceae bacterium]